MNNNKKYINIFTVSAVILIMSICSIAYNFYFNKDKEITYNYTIQKNDDYEVLLKPNEFYETETLKSGSYYAANSISKYIINLKHDFLLDKKTNLEYEYNIDAYLIGFAKTNDNQDKEVWNRKFIIKEKNKDKKNNIDKINISEEINIDYEYYNNLARSYERMYKITIDSVLKVRFNISYIIENSNKVEDFIELEIPITSTISEVKENYEKNINGEIVNEQENKKITKIVSYIISGIICLASSIVILISIIKNIKAQRKKYDWKLKRILKNNRDIIIEVSTEPNLENLKVINICTIEDLIKLAEQSQRNILYYNRNIKKLFVFIDKYVYIYLP